MNAVLQKMTDALDSGAVGLEQYVKVILAENTTDTDAYAAYAVVTAWLAMNDTQRYQATVDVLRPVMESQHPSVMVKGYAPTEKGGD